MISLDMTTRQYENSKEQQALRTPDEPEAIAPLDVGDSVEHEPRDHKHITRLLALGASILAIAGCGTETTTNVAKPYEPATTVSTTPEIPKNLINENPVFAREPSWLQNFNAMPDGPVDPNVWQVQVGNGVNGWGNHEAEYYTDRPTNLRIKNGVLIIQANKELYEGYRYTSARIDTEDKTSFRDGKINVVAKIPKGVGAWPAIWMLSSDNKYGTLHPDEPKTTYLDGEIDIMEAIGAEPGDIYGVPHSEVSQGHGMINLPDASSTFYNYSFERTPESLTFSVNGKPYYKVTKKPGASYKQWPFDQDYYLIMNVAMGGSWGGKGRDKYPPDGIDNRSLPAQMQIRSVAYYPMAVPKTKKSIK